MVFEICEQTDRQTNRHTDMLIAILYPPTGGAVISDNYVRTPNTRAPAYVGGGAGPHKKKFTGQRQTFYRCATQPLCGLHFRLASISKFWPRPRNIGFGLGLLASALRPKFLPRLTSMPKFWPRPRPRGLRLRPWPERRGRDRSWSLDFGLWSEANILALMPKVYLHYCEC